MKVLPQGQGLLGQLKEVREPLRLSHIASHPSSIGFPGNHPPMKTFLGMPIRHHGEHVGNIILTEKEGGPRVYERGRGHPGHVRLPGGAAIFNARKYLEGQPARADLEALLNISPVGVLVFDGKTGDLVSANEETSRLVGELNASGPSLSQLLEVMPPSKGGRERHPD